MRRTSWTDSARSDEPQRPQHVVVVEVGGRSASAMVALLGAAFTVSRVADVAAAVRAATQDAPDAVLIDAHPRPDHAAMVWCALRQRTVAPILVLAGSAETAQRIGAEVGAADACLVEPIAPAALIERLREQIERSRRRAGALPPPWRIDADARTVSIGPHALDLTPAEFRLLETLLRSVGQTHSRAALLDCIQEQQRDVCDRAIDLHVRSLRRKIAAVLQGRDVLVAVYGEGYRFEP